MCNLYSLTTGQAAIVALVRAMIDSIGNLPPMTGIFPDYPAPVARNISGGRELVMMRWGIPGPSSFGGAPITNVRNAKSPHWRPWLVPGQRCVVPANSFCEYADTKPRKTPTWFALDDSRPPFFFAGIWRSWRGTRGPKSAPVEGEHLLFSFLTTDANDIVRPIHPKAMPVMLTTPAEVDIWLDAPTDEALALQKPLPSERLRIVRTGNKLDEDEPASAGTLL